MRLSADAIWAAIDDGRIQFRAFEPERTMNDEGGPYNTDSVDFTMGGVIMMLKPPTGLKGFIVRLLRKWGICLPVAGPVWRPYVETWREYVRKHYEVVAVLTPDNPFFTIPAFSFALVATRENFRLATGNERKPEWNGKPCLVAHAKGKTGPARVQQGVEDADGLHAHDGIVCMEYRTLAVPVETYFGWPFCQGYFEETEGETRPHGSAVAGQTRPDGSKDA